MTALIYVDTRKRVGDPEHLKVVRRRGRRGDLVRGEPYGTCFRGARPPPAIGERRLNIRFLEPLFETEKTKTKSPAIGRALDRCLLVLKRGDLKRKRIAVHLFAFKQRFRLRRNTVEEDLRADGVMPFDG